MFKVLIIDLVGLKLTLEGQPDCSEVKAFIESQDGVFHQWQDVSEPLTSIDFAQYPKGTIHFCYYPQLADKHEILSLCQDGDFDGVIAAATFIPKKALFAEGGVRIGAGTGNMGSKSWGGGDGIGGDAPLMNTPGFNARATAQMVFKALLEVLPELPMDDIEAKVVEGLFDTGRDLVKHPCSALANRTIAVLGYGNIGREVAKLARAFGMTVRVFARSKHQMWISSEGFEYAASVLEAATGADILTPHLGLGRYQPQQKTYANSGLIDKTVLKALNPQAVVINFDRGELININALEQALGQNRLRMVAIDADIFVDAQGQSSGPLTPYIELYRKFANRMRLLPHVAADTEHYSRVAGAKQAVLQMIAAIKQKQLINVKGDVPAGYVNKGQVLASGVGAVQKRDFYQLSQPDIEQLAQLSIHLAEFWQEMAQVSLTTQVEAEECLLREELLAADAQSVTRAANQLVGLLTKNGLLGPMYDQ